MLKLRNWINVNKLGSDGLGINPNIQISEFRQDEIYSLYSSRMFYTDTNKNYDKNIIYWNLLCIQSRKDEMDFLEKNKKNIDWDCLCLNPNAIELLKKNQKKINWYYLSSNPNAIELLKENKYKINWDELSSNPNAIELLKKKSK